MGQICPKIQCNKCYKQKQGNVTTQFEYIKDLEYVKALLDANDETLANLLGVSRMTLNRWRKGISEPSPTNFKNFYNAIYKKGDSAKPFKGRALSIR